MNGFTVRRNLATVSKHSKIHVLFRFLSCAEHWHVTSKSLSVCGGGWLLHMIYFTFRSKSCGFTYEYLSAVVYLHAAQGCLSHVLLQHRFDRCLCKLRSVYIVSKKWQICDSHRLRHKADKLTFKNDRVCDEPKIRFAPILELQMHLILVSTSFVCVSRSLFSFTFLTSCVRCLERN